MKWTYLKNYAIKNILYNWIGRKLKSHHIAVWVRRASIKVLLILRPDAIGRPEHGLVLRLLLLLLLLGGLLSEEHPLRRLRRSKTRGHLHHGAGAPALHQSHEIVKSGRRVGWNRLCRTLRQRGRRSARPVCCGHVHLHYFHCILQVLN